MGLSASFPIERLDLWQELGEDGGKTTKAECPSQYINQGDMPETHLVAVTFVTWLF